jgi:ADP-heptose:LPS heptosyltransferase
LTRILVIKLGALGDVIQALGPMAAIRRHHRDARITVLTTAPFADLLAASGHGDAVWVDDRAPIWRLDRWLALRDKLKSGGFTRVYDLQTSRRSSAYFHLLRPNPPEWSGIASGCSHPHANPARDSMHTIDRQREQLAQAGIADVPPSDVSWLDADLASLALPEAIALLVPGGAAHRPGKRWPVERYGELAAALATRGLTPVVLGMTGERGLAAAIVARCKSARDLSGRTSLSQLAALGRRARVAIGNDTGPMHLLAVAGAPSVVLFSAASDPALCAPRARAVMVLRRATLADLPVAEVDAAAMATAAGAP